MAEVKRLKIFIYIDPILRQIAKHHAAQKKTRLTHFHGNLLKK